MGLLLGVIELPSFHFLATKTKMLILCPQFAFRPILDWSWLNPVAKGHAIGCFIGGQCFWELLWEGQSDSCSLHSGNLDELSEQQMTEKGRVPFM